LRLRLSGDERENAFAFSEFCVVTERVHSRELSEEHAFALQQTKQLTQKQQITI
jgi:hypothetical protein